MDARNVRIMKPYVDSTCKEGVVYVDDDARSALHVQWGEHCLAVGRRKVKVEVQPLKDEDWNAQVIRMNDKLRQEIYCTVGDELLLYNLE